jgi:hypothetical protein
MDDKLPEGDAGPCRLYRVTSESRPSWRDQIGSINERLQIFVGAPDLVKAINENLLKKTSKY